MASEHPFHQFVGKKLGDLALPKGSDLFLDSACRHRDYPKKTHNLPLFADIWNYVNRRYEAVEFTDVDAFFTFKNKIRVIVEIEESGVRPNKLCSKMLSAALSDYYKRGDDRIHLDEKILFIQVLKAKSMERQDPMSSTWLFLESKFNELNVVDGRTISYAVYCGIGKGLVGTSNTSLEDRIMAFLNNEVPRIGSKS